LHGPKIIPQAFVELIIQSYRSSNDVMLGFWRDATLAVLLENWELSDRKSFDRMFHEQADSYRHDSRSIVDTAKTHAAPMGRAN